MALTPTEREEHFFKAMVDVAGGSTPEELEPTERREHWYKEIIDAIKSGGGGSGGGVLVVHETVSGGTHTLDKTWQEIYDAGYSVLVVVEGSDVMFFAITYISSSPYIVSFGGGAYTAASASDYPSYEEGH